MAATRARGLGSALRGAALWLWRRGAAPALRPTLARLTSDGTLRWHRAQVADVPVTGYCMYRARNAGYVASIVASAAPGSHFHLHALDDVAPELAGWTRSQGRGARIPLFHALLAQQPPTESHHVMLFDDDATLPGDGVRLFVGLAAAAELELAQPAHVFGSHTTFRTSRVDPPATVRLVRFIESGPVVLFSPDTARRLLPLPQGLLMGWGVDVWWSALQDPPLLKGIVDATPLVHHGPVGVAYPAGPEAEILDRYLAQASLTSAHQLDSNVGLTWRPWQRQPKWRRGGPADGSTQATS